VDRSEMEFIAIDQQHARFDATKVHGNAVDNSLEQIVQVEDRSDLLSGFLQREQSIDTSLLKDRCLGK
jgi:hypothetical protein